MPIFELSNGITSEIGKVYEVSNGIISGINKVHEVNAGITREVYTSELQVVINPTEFPISNYKSVGGASLGMAGGTKPYVIIHYYSSESVAKGMYITLNVSGYSNCHFNFHFTQGSGIGSNRCSAGYSFGQSPNYANLYDGYQTAITTYIDKNINIAGQTYLTLFVGSAGHIAGVECSFNAYINTILLT